MYQVTLSSTIIDSCKHQYWLVCSGVYNLLNPFTENESDCCFITRMYRKAYIYRAFGNGKFLTFLKRKNSFAMIEEEEIHKSSPFKILQKSSSMFVEFFPLVLSSTFSLCNLFWEFFSHICGFAYLSSFLFCRKLSEYPPILLLNATNDMGLDVDGRRFYRILERFGTVLFHFHIHFLLFSSLFPFIPFLQSLFSSQYI